jgi:dipeptidyl aminopeptidase/acylaminoacyl peptidase
MRRVLAVSFGLFVVGMFVVQMQVPGIAVVPGANGLIAFQSDRDGDHDIYTVKPNGTGLTNLTNANTTLDQDPAWSPDGTRIAFSRRTTTAPCASSGCKNIFVMNPNGSGVTQLTFESLNGKDNTAPAWSPDGQWIVYAGNHYGTKDVFKVPASGGAPTRLTTDALDDFVPDWSPDGSKIVFTSTRDGEATLYTMNPDGSSQSPLALSGSPPASFSRDGAWSPSGSKLVFSGANDLFVDETHVYTSNVNGSAATAVYSPSTFVYTPAWSPDGSRIVLSTDVGGSSSFDLRILDPSNGNATALSASPGADMNPSWQPTSGSSPSPSASPSPSPSPSPSSSSSASPSPSPSPTETPTPPPGTHIEVDDDRFDPTAVTLARGGTAVFDYVGDQHHTATDDSGLDLYDSGVVDGGDPSTWFTFTAAGVYRFTCTLHPWMGGRVEVPVRAAPASGRERTRFTVTWASAAPATGLVHDVQIRRPGGEWKTWRDGVLGLSKTFRSDKGPGVYRFRARVRNAAGDASLWSLEADIKVTR